LWNELTAFIFLPMYGIDLSNLNLIKIKGII
jgi:hypothetical protein